MAEQKPMTDYVELPKFDEYKEWFKQHFELRREDGILEVKMATNGGPMYWSGMAHRAMTQLMRVISMDLENEIIIWSFNGEDWMKDSDEAGWATYAEERFTHQYFDDENLIKNMIFDIQVPTIGAMNGPGAHWDSNMLCDITIASDDCRWDDPHLHYGLIPGDGMGLMLQHFLGTKRGNYYMYTSRQFTAQEALDMGWVSEIVPKGTVLDRAWEIARMLKTVPYETRCIMSHLAKRPLQKMWVEDFKLHSVSEQYSTMIKIAQGKLGNAKEDKNLSQLDEAYMGDYSNWKYAPGMMDMTEPQTVESWNIHERAMQWVKEHKDK